MKSKSHFGRSAGLVGCLLAGLLLLLLALQSLAAGTYYDNSGQSLGGLTTYDLALADVDGDTDIDVLAANNGANRVWLNGGSGFFSQGATLGSLSSRGAALAHLNNDSFIDAFIANDNGDNQVWLGNGSGGFTQLAQTLNPADLSQDVALADMNGDTFVDAVVVANGTNSMWANDGSGFFEFDTSFAVNRPSHEVVLGDVDNDNDLDIYVANGAAGFVEDELWFNNGTGIFSTTGQTYSGAWNEGAALGDLDGDNDLDLYLATWSGSDAVWLNQGGIQGGAIGSFVDSGQSLSSGPSTDVTLVDVDQNGSLDAVVANWTGSSSEIWLNDGSGNFTLAGETLSSAANYEVASGDLDGDNDDDLFFGNFSSNEVWFRGGAGIPDAFFEVESRMNPAGDDTYPWALPGSAGLPVVFEFGSTEPLDLIARIEYESGTVTQTIFIPPGQTMQQLDVNNPGPNPEESVLITLQVEPNAAADDLVQVNPLTLVFIDGLQGPTECPLCMVDWLVQLLGFSPTFYNLHHLNLTPVRASDVWPYYTAFMGAYGEEFSTIIMTNPGLLWQSFDTLEEWTPAIEAYDAGQGSSTLVTQGMIDDMLDLFSGIRDNASPALAQQIQIEMDAIQLEDMAGATMDDLVDRIIQRVEGRRFLPVVVRP